MHQSVDLTAPKQAGLLELETQALSVVIDPAAGAEITHVSVPEGPNALACYDWASPRPAESSLTYGSSQLDWLSRYRGGWQELIPNSGSACDVDGVPMAFHGDASLTAWEVVELDNRHCTLRTATRLPLVVERRMELDELRPVLRIEERVLNESDLEVEFLWGHHPVFPATPGARIDLPACTVEAEVSIASGFDAWPAPWPFLRTTDGEPVDLREIPEAQLERVLYASGMSEAWAALRQPGALPSVAMSWDASTFPCVWVWLQRGAPGFPHFGRSEMIGIEPHAAYPFDGLAAARGRGRALRIGPGGVRNAWLTMVLLPDGERAVDGVDRAGEVSFGGGS